MMDLLDGSAITYQRQESSRRTTLIPPVCQRGHGREAGAIIEHIVKIGPVDFWFSLNSGERQENCKLMKVYMIWPVIHNSSNAKTMMRTWEVQGVDMGVKELILVELLEDLADLFTKISGAQHFVEGVLRVGCKMEAKHKLRKSCVQEASNWIKSTGESNALKLQEVPENVRNRALQTFFTEYAFFLIKMAQDYRAFTEEIRLQSCEMCDMEAKHYRQLGKKAFEKGLFATAEDNYTSAIRYSPEDHILFSNRALCYTRLEKYGKAMCDGKKAVLIKNTWPKGHYRFCEALFLLGEHERALKSNEWAQELCRKGPDSINDLLQQHSRFIKQIKEEAALGKKGKKRIPEKKKDLLIPKENKNIQAVLAVLEDAGAMVTPSEPSCAEYLRSWKPREATYSEQTEERPKDVTVPKQSTVKSKGKASESADKPKNINTKNNSKETQKIISPMSPQVDPVSIMDTVKTLVREGYEALADQRYHNAEGIFSQILEFLDQDYQLRLTKIDCVVLLYGHANALLGIRKSAELERAENQFKEIMQQYSKERFNCLAFYGIGNVYFKQNRFSDALNQYVKSKTLLAHKMVPGVLTWPTTSIVIEETRPERLKVLLDNCIEECKFPPKPDAVCRFENCLSLPKIQIYFTDPDFRGFIRMACCDFCILEYHVCCWKKLKATSYSDKNDKDFLKYNCLTPDCRGVISHIVIYDSTGELKCEFEDKTVKSKKEPPKPVIKQKSTSTRKPKTRKENIIEKKEALEEEPVDQAAGDNRLQLQEKPLCDPVTNGYHIPRDPLLFQVIKKQKLIIRGCPISFPLFWESVAAWGLLDLKKLSDVDRSSPSHTNIKMQHLLYHLYNANDRVKARVLLYLLKVHHDFLSSDLQEWILIVDEKGLQAADEFRTHNEELLKSINPQDVIYRWNDFFGKNMNYVMSAPSSGNLYDSLADMDKKYFRCFVWFLEENRDITSVSPLGKELDKYFQEMDIPIVSTPVYSLKELSNKCVRVKPKHRKKKQNQPKPLYKISGAISTRSQEDDLPEENTLSLLDPNDPFVVPEFLQPDIEEFQILYDPYILEPQYEMLVDDSMEPVRETLYNYFSQILDEHGPLSLDDEILIREYREFPEETHRMVEASGGLKNFLLQSFEFTMVGDMIAHADYDFPCEGSPEESSHLNPAAAEFKPLFSRPVTNGPDLYNAPVDLEPDRCSPGVAATDPQALVQSESSFNYGNFADLCHGLDHRNSSSLTSELSGNSTDDLEPDTYDNNIDEVLSISDSDPDSSSVEQDASLYSTNQGPLSTGLPETSSDKVSLNAERRQTAIVSVQVDVEVSHCEANTDAFLPFESQPGDILRMEKEHTVLADQLQETTEKYENMRGRYLEEIASLEGQIKDTIESNKITKTELNWLQQDYENESKKWHQERKERQDKIKALKNNNKMAADANDKVSRTIEEKKKQYESYIQDFARIHKFENEKAKLEKHTRRSEEELEEAKQRAMAAEVIVLENRKQGELLKLRFQAGALERNINMIRAVATSNPAPQYMQQLHSMEPLMLKLKKDMDTIQGNSLQSKITLRDYFQKTVATSTSLVHLESLRDGKGHPMMRSAVLVILFSLFLSLAVAPLYQTVKEEAQFDEKINTLKSALKICSLTHPAVQSLSNVSVEQSRTSPDPLPAPKSPAPASASAKPANPNPSKSQAKKNAKKSKKAASLTKPGASANNPPAASAPKQVSVGHDRRGPAQHEPKPQSPAKPTLFDKIIDELRDIFPHYQNAELAGFIKEFRVKNKGTLAGLMQEEIVSRVTEFILDYQTNNPAPASPSPTAMSFTLPGTRQPSASPQPKQPWRVVAAGAKNKWQNPDDLESCYEDPCIICHDELKQSPVHKLDCGHFFHKECIKTWLHTQSTCPTCREHVLLPEDYPMLSGRMRTA